MNKPQPRKPTLVIAGPGAGKTRDMVERMLEKLPALHPSRYMAAITFTNAAANNIRNRLNSLARPTANVFTGTIHSFLNRFIIAPFARPMKSLPNDRIFAAVEVDDPPKILGTRQLSVGDARARRNQILKALQLKGVVPFECMVQLSRNLLGNPTILSRVSNRLQFLFIDEFQDVDIGQLEIFEKLRRKGETQVFAVGDPEQFISSFTYRGTRCPPFGNIPFFRFRNVAESSSMVLNHRSCSEIVSFTNSFREEPTQHSAVGPRNEPRVLFIGQTDLTSIIYEFRHRSEGIPQSKDGIERLYLGYKNSTFDDVRQEFGIRHLSNGSRRQSTLLQDALELLMLCRGSPLNRTLKELRITDHDLRKWGLTLIRSLRENPSQSVESFKEQWLPKLDIPPDTKHLEKATSESFDHLKAAIGASRQDSCKDWSSSIHRAKGLEAKAVLVVASGLDELKKWCMTDSEKRGCDKRDTCRIGYVAFSRAAELLCIACSQPLDSAAEALLRALGVPLV
jgi:ATP-dependent DNA helicase UvrD/PcrA